MRAVKLSKTPGGIVTIERDCRESVVVEGRQLVQERVAFETVQQEKTDVAKHISTVIFQENITMGNKSSKAHKRGAQDLHGGSARGVRAARFGALEKAVQHHDRNFLNTTSRHKNTRERRKTHGR